MFAEKNIEYFKIKIPISNYYFEHIQFRSKLLTMKNNFRKLTNLYIKYY